MGIKFKVGSNPHIRSNHTTNIIMTDFLISLIPIIIVGSIFFKSPFVHLLFFSISFAILMDILISNILKLPKENYYLSSIITAILLTLSVPATVPIWVIFFGLSFAIIIAKFVFGGLGQNFFNPALLGRVFLMLSFPQYTFDYRILDGEVGGTVLRLIKNNDFNNFDTTIDTLKNLIFNINIHGSPGECSLIALFIGYLYLCLRKRISYFLPLLTIFTVIISGYLLGINGLYYALSGGVVFGSIFFLTDPVTSPYTPLGKKVYAVFIAILIVIIRVYSSYPEGVAYAILFGNIFTPLFNKLFVPKVFGRRRDMKEFWNLIKIISFAIISIYFLYLIDNIFESKIEIQKEKILVKEMKTLIPEGVIFDLYENSEYCENFLFIPVYNSSDKKIAYIVRGKSKGYSDKDMEFLLGIDLNGKTTGHKIISHQETLGLGSKITENAYKNLWKSKDINTKFNKKTDAPTGATYTFLNFFKTVKNVLEIYDKNILKKNTKKNNVTVKSLVPDTLNPTSSSAIDSETTAPSSNLEQVAEPISLEETSSSNDNSQLPLEKGVSE